MQPHAASQLSGKCLGARCTSIQESWYNLLAIQVKNRSGSTQRGRDVKPPLLFLGLSGINQQSQPCRGLCSTCHASSSRISSRATRGQAGDSARGGTPQSRYLNNRCENSHRPTRQRGRRMQDKSAGHAQRFLSAYGPIAQHFRPRRHRLSASAYREDAKPFRELGRNYRYGAGCLSVGSMEIASGKCLLLPGDNIIPNNLTYMDPPALSRGFRMDKHA